ncbi:MAG: hypothetical protein J0L92_22610 [Deltaproteobacteria bacterium]|nr:hypothetical protein [Deltaproteobacteria bacterium]
MSEETPETPTPDEATSGEGTSDAAMPPATTKTPRRALPEDVVAPIGKSIVAILGALVVAAAPFVPSILWYTGNTLFDDSSTDLTFAEAAWMIASHEVEHHEGVFLFALPSLFALAALCLRSQLGLRRVWHALSLASVVIAVIELVFVFADTRYGTTYRTIASFFGIQSMIPEDRFSTHAFMLLGGSITWAIGEELRHRTAT